LSYIITALDGSQYFTSESVGKTFILTETETRL